MAGVEIRDYSGDYEDLAALAEQALLPEHTGGMWAALPEVSFLRWQLGAPTGGRYVTAYDGERLVGGVFSIPHSLRIGSSVLPIALIGGLMTDAKYRRLALPLVEQLRRRHAEAEIAFSLGLIATDPASVSYRFWTRYGQTFPQNLRYLFKTGYWVKMLAPQHLARAGVNAWERLAARAFGPLLGFLPLRQDPHVRPYHAQDLDQCAQILDQSAAACDWSLVWSRDQLMHRLESPVTGTVIFERAGRVQGMVNYHCVLASGRQPVRIAVVALWAEHELTGGQRVRLLGQLCNHLRAQDVHVAVAPRTVMMPTSALAANVFLPISGQFHVAALLTRRDLALAPPKTWNLVIM
jgi:Acetyltransferase (GNAT) domain